jgi:hypothetical protein
MEGRGKLDDADGELVGWARLGGRGDEDEQGGEDASEGGAHRRDDTTQPALAAIMASRAGTGGTNRRLRRLKIKSPLREARSRQISEWKGSLR